MKTVTIKQLVHSRMWDLVIVLLVGYGSKNHRLRVYENVDWTVCHSDHRYFFQRLLFALKQFYEPDQ